MKLTKDVLLDSKETRQQLNKVALSKGNMTVKEIASTQTAFNTNRITRLCVVDIESEIDVYIYEETLLDIFKSSSITKQYEKIRTICNEQVKKEFDKRRAAALVPMQNLNLFGKEMEENELILVFEKNIQNCLALNGFFASMENVDYEFIDFYLYPLNKDYKYEVGTKLIWRDMKGNYNGERYIGLLSGYYDFDKSFESNIHEFVEVFRTFNIISKDYDLEVII